MSHRPPFSRVVRGALGTCLVLCAGACTGVVSLDPTIGPDEAISVPALLGDWLDVDEEDSTWIRITPGADDKSYVLEIGDPISFDHVLPLGLATLSFRVAPAGDRLFAEAIPSHDDPLVDSLTRRYAHMVQLVYMAALVNVVGDDLQVSVFERDSVRAALEAGRCPSPGRVIEREDALIFSGDSRELRRARDCLIAVPGLVEPSAYYHRVTSP